uniref:ATP synthase complex subunit 8 n=1 Tax=Atrobucca nibe TaxID=1003939 RepID=A0A343K094_9TELE|nr:ATP synthase F0 subunit 8 [Atrobucca nibe]ATA66342.1 ATP synthase F0 subunit 8 [Atrobucca nibe]QDS78244.1 ATP synthase F0 subunit 8 [Atrobucca nibe]UEV86513.1 ATP synthase F0 subunit 8 [Atrobucca nibe]
MPQLNPSPWLAIMIFSWLTFLIIIPPKIMAHLFPNEPAPQDLKSSKTGTWNWPWV